MPEMNPINEKVEFKIPDHKKIVDEGMICADMHFHTNSSDSYTDANSLMKLAKARNTGVAITDHNLIGTLKKIDVKRADVFIVPGMEVSTTDGPHILTYFYDMNDLEHFWENIIRPRIQQCPWLALKDCTVEQLLDRLEEYNCVTSGAHPMGYFHTNKGVEACNVKGYISDDVVERLNAYEVICSGMSRKNNLDALIAADRHHLAYTGGTDGHLLFELGNVVTVSKVSDLDGFLRDVSRGNVKIIGSEKTPMTKVQMGSASFSKFVMHAPSALFVQVKQGGKSIERKFKKIA